MHSVAHGVHNDWFGQWIRTALSWETYKTSHRIFAPVDGPKIKMIWYSFTLLINSTHSSALSKIEKCRHYIQVGL